MLYAFLFWRMNSAAAITSLVSATPESSITSIGRILALGAAAVRPKPEPAAIPATRVPWPRPSPGEFGVRLVNVTWGRTREPESKSARFASIPESTIAIVGACGAAALQSHAFPDVYGQSCFDQRKSEASRTRASGVIVR